MDKRMQPPLETGLEQNDVQMPRTEEAVQEQLKISLDKARADAAKKVGKDIKDMH